MNWQKIANIAGPRGADGVDGEAPDIEWRGTALSVNGALGPDLRGPQGTPGNPGADSTVPGPPGDRGAPGPAPSIKIGTVTSGATPSATITGTSPDLTLGLVLPKGDKGETGPPGVVSSASSYILVGPGRPDVPSTTAGTITGAEPVGARYESVDEAGVGARTWRKVAGNKWIVTDGDTGWRDVTATLVGITGGRFTVRRIGSNLSIAFEQVFSGGATLPVGTYNGGGFGLRLPAGFTPANPGSPGPRYFHAGASANILSGIDRSVAGVMHVQVDTGDARRQGALVLQITKEDKLSGGWLQVATTDPWPTSPLPGSPA